MNIKTIDLFDLNHTIASDFLKNIEFPWQILPKIGEIIMQIAQNLDLCKFDEVQTNVWVAKSAKIYPNNYIEGPCIIGEESQVRPGAFIRGNALVGERCVVGNSTELKNVILFDGVQVPHYNYVGDSVLGYKAHMGAGSITSNVKSDRENVVINNEGIKIETGLKKLGAFLGDNVEVGCNSVLNPGCIIGRNTSIYPLSSVRGCKPENSIYKNEGEIVLRQR